MLEWNLSLKIILIFIINIITEGNLERGFLFWYTKYDVL